MVTAVMVVRTARHGHVNHAINLFTREVMREEEWKRRRYSGGGGGGG